jgi:cbb3-type cytochrome oxidase maturation protein
MSILFLLIPLSVVVAGGFLLAFIWAVKSGQYEDTCTPAMRLLTEEHTTKPKINMNPSEPNKPQNQ